MNIKKLTTLKEPLEINIQLIATELDTSANYLRCVAKEWLEDGIEIECFDKLINDIESNGVEITSFDDNTIMYEFDEEAIIIHTILGVKYLIFDSNISLKIKNKMAEFNKE